MMLNLSPYNIKSQRDFYYEHLPNLDSNKLEGLANYIKHEFPNLPDGYNNDPQSTQNLKRHAWYISQQNNFYINLLYSNILNAAKRANKKFNFDLNSILELKYFEYGPSLNQGLDWHIDIGSKEASLRKLSFSLLISNETEYEGGQLEIWLDSTFQQSIPKVQGSITFFPSFLLHRVTPITKGTRRVIVGWLGGTPYK